MLVRHHRLAIAGVITAAAIAVPTAALASGSGSPSGKPAPPQACAASACKSKASQAAAIKSPARSPLAALAASAGISTDRLQAGLAAAKRAGGNTAASIAAFAASTGVSHATAQRVVYAVFGTRFIKSVTVPAAVKALATRLGVNTSAAGRVEADRCVEQQKRWCRPGQLGVRRDRPRSRREPGPAGRRLGRSQAERGRQVSGVGRRESRAQ